MKKYFSILIISFSFLLACDNRTQCETFLIPQNYVGEVKVYYGMKEGQSKVNKNNCREYIISDRGTCFTVFPYEKNGTAVLPGQTYKYYILEKESITKEIFEFDKDQYLSDSIANKSKKYVSYYFAGLENGIYTAGFSIDSGYKFYEKTQIKK